MTLCLEIIAEASRRLPYTFKARAQTCYVIEMDEIVRAIDILGYSPLIGRPVNGGKRELIIGRRARGYVALYPFVDSIDTVFVLAIRGQREDGYRADQ